MESIGVAASREINRYMIVFGVGINANDARLTTSALMVKTPNRQLKVNDLKPFGFQEYS
jgi:hypothetical protein